MPRNTLSVWLHGIHIAQLSEPSRYRLRLDFTDQALDTFGEGSRALSLALPISRQPAQDTRRRPGAVAAFIEGLLPEGNMRAHIATQAGIPITDTMGLLTRVGAECAGAVQILADNATPGSGDIRRLSPQELTRLVADLPTYRLPPGATPQASLAGIQDKVLLAALPNNDWGWPQNGAASTHIIKPEPLTGALTHLVQTEDWALHVAQAAGIPAAQSRLERFDEREAIIVTRYDRSPDGTRQHQEDFCQALGLNPQAKYESTSETTQSGSRLRRLARAAAPRAHDPDAFRLALLHAVTFNVVIGNGDAHSKNYSLLLARDGSVSLAPIYDAAPVMHLNPRFKGTGHIINAKTSIDTIDIDDLAAEATTWGMSTRRARDAVHACMERIYSAVETVPLPPGTEHVRSNFERLWAQRCWATPRPARRAERGQLSDTAGTPAPPQP